MFENVCENQAWDRYPQDVYVSWYVHMLYTILKHIKTIYYILTKLPWLTVNHQLTNSFIAMTIDMACCHV